MKYEGKQVIVTGTSRGVGFMLANYFLDNGAIVIGISKSTQTIQRNNYYHFEIDLSDPVNISNSFKMIAKQFKRIDILINNAAVMTSQFSMILPLKNVIDMINVNFLGVFLVSRECAKLMRGKEPGRIINIGSMASKLEPIGDSIYAATKSAVITATNVLAKELAPYNVTCNTLGITAIETDMLNSHSDNAKLKIKDIINGLTIPRLATVEDISNVVDFYSSNQSSYITAQTIYLGGIN